MNGRDDLSQDVLKYLALEMSDQIVPKNLKRTETMNSAVTQPMQNSRMSLFLFFLLSDKQTSKQTDNVAACLKLGV